MLDIIRPKELLAVLVIQSGDIVIDEQGRLWRHAERYRGQVLLLDEPRRLDRPDRVGYHRFQVYYAGREIALYAHRVVWVYHNGIIPRGLEVNHKDGDKGNNRLSNLELVTHRRNMLHWLEELKPLRNPKV